MLWISASQISVIAASSCRRRSHLFMIMAWSQSLIVMLALTGFPPKIVLKHRTHIKDKRILIKPSTFRRSRSEAPVFFLYWMCARAKQTGTAPRATSWLNVTIPLVKVTVSQKVQVSDRFRKCLSSARLNKAFMVMKQPVEKTLNKKPPTPQKKKYSRFIFLLLWLC